jgi:thiamine pyrophosphokinase
MEKFDLEKIAVIVCNGSISDYTYYHKYFIKAEFIISVDGGATHLRKLGITPDVLLGDFDSIIKEDYEYYKNIPVEIIQFPPEKDMTDTELAVEFAMNKGYNTFVFIGALGSRYDHSMANIFILKKLLDKGIKGVIVNETNEIILIRDKIKINKEEGIKVTLLPLSETVEGVTTKGLYYPLLDAVLEMCSTWGVSNEFVADIAEISLRKGLLLVIKSRD